MEFPLEAVTLVIDWRQSVSKVNCQLPVSDN